MYTEHQEYYRSRYIASVVIEDGSIHVLGGPKEKRELRLAKRKTETCYVRNVAERSEIKLTLVDGDWAVAQ